MADPTISDLVLSVGTQPLEDYGTLVRRSAAWDTPAESYASTSTSAVTDPLGSTTTLTVEANVPPVSYISSSAAFGTTAYKPIVIRRSSASTGGTSEGFGYLTVPVGFTPQQPFTMYAKFIDRGVIGSSAGSTSATVNAISFLGKNSTAGNRSYLGWNIGSSAFEFSWNRGGTRSFVTLATTGTTGSVIELLGQVSTGGLATLYQAVGGSTSLTTAASTSSAGVHTSTDVWNDAYAGIGNDGATGTHAASYETDLDAIALKVAVGGPWTMKQMRELI